MLTYAGDAADGRAQGQGRRDREAAQVQKYSLYCYKSTCFTATKVLALLLQTYKY